MCQTHMRRVVTQAHLGVSGLAPQGVLGAQVVAHLWVDEGVQQGGAVDDLGGHHQVTLPSARPGGQEAQCADLCGPRCVWLWRREWGGGDEQEEVACGARSGLEVCNCGGVGVMECKKKCAEGLGMVKGAEGGS